jgi:glycosyltransferase involved in cell wall biosynthesis
LKTAVAVQVFRRRLLRQVTRIVAIAPRDAESLAAAVRRTVSIVPNGVELVTTSPHPHDREPLAIFTGAMSFSPNEEAACYLARVIWPQVLARVPDARLALVGTDPTPRVQALAGSNNVMVTGRVKDMREWLQRARVATAPMLTGTGMKNKVLEACASACPVVATTMGAAGLPVGESNGILIADAPSALAGALVALLKDARRAEQIGLAGAAMARERFNWSHSVDLLWTVIQQATGMTDPNWSTTRQSRPALSAIEPTIGKEELIHAAS